MTRGLVAKIVLTALAVLVCVDDAEAGRRRRRGNDCCCESGTGGSGNYGGGYSGYASATPTYSNMYASGCQSTGPVSTYPTPMGGGYTTGYGDPRQFGVVQFSEAGTGAIASDKGRLRIHVPMPDARLWINNQQIQMGGADRTLDVSLASNQSQKYTLTAQWTKDGREIVRKKEVEVRPGQESTVTFSDTDDAGGSEQIPSNPNATPNPVNPPIRPDANLPKADRP
jgi:uncharacterized protein (TIGR03000 family)